MNIEQQPWLGQKWGEACVNNLVKHGFDAHLTDDFDQARTLALELASSFQTFGFGGSATVRELKLPDELRARGKTILDHWQAGLTPPESLEIRRKQLLCDCFFCSANALSITGEIVNVDGVGNRVGAMIFGPAKVIIIAGINKIRPDLSAAIARVREIAAPMRAKSLGIDTPCAKTGLCNDCNTPLRICNVTAILHRKPTLTDCSVIVINRPIGY